LFLSIMQAMVSDSSFDFDAAVSAPFRMQPGLRRLASGARQLTPLAPGSRHQREKLAVLSAFWPQALCAQADADAAPALQALCVQAAAEHPQAWQWDGRRAQATLLGTAVSLDGHIEQLATGSFGLGDEVSRCLQGLPAEWRLVGLLSLAFAEDFALVDGASGCITWLAVALPSHWAPEDKVGRHFASVHAPVADNQLLLKASDALMKMVCGPERWERFVWTISDNPRLHAHPLRTDPLRWQHTAVPQAWFRSERQTFIPLPERQQAVFTIHIEVRPLRAVLDSPQRAQTLHDAVASMSPAVLDYRGLAGVREPLLQWLAATASSA
jgi:dimethylamine monooxygenase subunit A